MASTSFLGGVSIAMLMDMLLSTVSVFARPMRMPMPSQNDEASEV